jgi:hypothetical protein
VGEEIRAAARKISRQPRETGLVRPHQGCIDSRHGSAWADGTDSAEPWSEVMMSAVPGLDRAGGAQRAHAMFERTRRPAGDYFRGAQKIPQRSSDAPGETRLGVREIARATADRPDGAGTKDARRGYNTST